MSDLLPLFPLPNVVLFPNVFLPLHIFEPRYRDMVADALATDRLIGMALLRPGWEPHYEGTPPVFAMGCSGVITHVERLSDGRYDIVLRGVERFRILNENCERRYRRAAVAPAPERPLDPDGRAALRGCRSRLERLLAPAMTHDTQEPGRTIDPKVTAAMGDEDLVNALAQYLSFDPLEKQALLEQESLRERAESLVELFEMKLMMARTPGLSNVAH
jgi:hypothetical protein